MRFCILFVFIIAINVIYGEWANRAILSDAVTYFDKVMQETILELENRGFCNLKLDDITQSINLQMYKWHVIGNVTYTNGFLVSVQKMDVTDVGQSIRASTIDGVVQNMASVQGHLNIRDMKIGYDVLAELGDDGDHRFTGTFVHTLARFQFGIMKNLDTQVITTSHTLDSFSGGLDRMIYMPANNITQVISRAYTPSNIFSSVGNWGREVIAPIILDIATNKIVFPRVCLDCR